MSKTTEAISCSLINIRGKILAAQPSHKIVTVARVIVSAVVKHGFHNHVGGVPIWKGTRAEQSLQRRLKPKLWAWSRAHHFCSALLDLGHVATKIHPWCSRCKSPIASPQLGVKRSPLFSPTDRLIFIIKI